MSLLKKASIITTPTAYAEDYLYSIKPAIPFGDELIVNGSFSNGSYTGWSQSGTWNAANYVEITDNGARLVTDGTGVGLHQTRMTVGKSYRFTFDVTVATLGSVKFDGATGGISAVGSYSYTFVATQTVLTYYRNSGAADITVDNVSLKEVTDADFDFDRNSTGTRVNEDYLIEDVPYNFVMHSEEFSSSNYTKSGISVVSDDIIAPNGTLTADKIVEDTSNGAHQIFDAVTTNSGNFTNSIMVKAAGRTKIRLSSGSNSHRVDFDLSTATKSNEVGATGSIVSVSDGWYRCVVSWNNTILAAQYLLIALLDNSGNTSYTGDGSSGVYIWGAQVVKGDQPKDYLKTTDRLDIPRIDYTNGEPSILLEPSRTNLETKSNEFSTWGLVSNVTRTASYTQSPEGLDNATRLQFTANGFTASFTQSNSTQYTLSCYAKRNDSGTQNVGFFVDGSGAVDSQFALTSTWQRFTYTYTSTNTSYAGLAGLSGADVSVYGMQVEAGSYATSLIHTSGSAVTRSADVANNAGNSDLINSTEGVLYVDFSALSTTGRDEMRFLISNGTNNERVQIGLQANNTFYTSVITSNVASAVFTTTLSDVTIKNKLAISYKENLCKFFINGRQIGITDISATMPTGLNRLDLYRQPSGNNYIYGNVKMVAVFKEALTDLELEKLTGYNNHELYMNYYNRLSYLGLAEEYNVESDINNYIL